jgi:hypothetical protein
MNNPPSTFTLLLEVQRMLRVIWNVVKILLGWDNL